jgi:hypothetical protein
MRVGNLFELAEKQLIKEKKAGIIPCYTLSDVIEYAIKIRKFLDKPSIERQKILKKQKQTENKYALIMKR